MVKSFLFKSFLLIFSHQILLFELEPYENTYTENLGTGKVVEKLEEISDGIWKISSKAKHPLFAMNQESFFKIDKMVRFPSSRAVLGWKMKIFQKKRKKKDEN